MSPFRGKTAERQPILTKEKGPAPTVLLTGHMTLRHPASLFGLQVPRLSNERHPVKLSSVGRCCS